MLEFRFAEFLYLEFDLVLWRKYLRSGGIKAVFVHFQGLLRSTNSTPNIRFYPSSSLILAKFLDNKSS